MHHAFMHAKYYSFSIPECIPNTNIMHMIKSKWLLVLLASPPFRFLGILRWETILVTMHFSSGLFSLAIPKEKVVWIARLALALNISALLPCMENNEYKERSDYVLDLIGAVYKCLTLKK